jgi:hypothetical protein
MMYVVIDAECSAIPENAKPLTTEGSALLNFLLHLNYDPAAPPLADVLSKYHHLEGDWLVVSPVHWEATHNDAMIVAHGSALRLQKIEAKSWFNQFATYLAEEDKVLYYHNPETWLLYDDKKHPLSAKPVHHLLNQSLMPELAQLDNTLYWQKFITESQMFFASKPNQSLINGLWIWGNTKLKNKKDITVCADEHFLSIAQMCSFNVVLYRPEVLLKDYDVLLLAEPSQLSASHQEELTKRAVHWYWNNAAYTVSNSSWLTRLWRKLIHDY